MEALSLDTPSEHLSNYVLVWKLQPYLLPGNLALIDDCIEKQASQCIATVPR